MKVKAAELRAKATAELQTFLNEVRRKLFKMRLLKASQELAKTHEIREARRTVARIETILKEKVGKRDE